MSEGVRDILIAGGGLAGWYCAARLCHAMRGRALNVRVLRAAPAGAAVDPLEVFCSSTLSAVPLAHAELGIDERTFMRDCDATFKLATEYRGFDDASRGYFLPFGEIGARLEAVGFHQFIGRLMRGGREYSLDDFSVPAIAARHGRFAHPTRDPRSVLSTYEYAYHLDTQAYTRTAARLRRKTRRRRRGRRPGALRSCGRRHDSRADCRRRHAARRRPVHRLHGRARRVARRGFANAVRELARMAALRCRARGPPARRRRPAAVHSRARAR